MTVCVAAVCDKGKGLILASDKMIGTASIEAELDIEKTFQIHPRWRVMFAAEDLAPIPDILRSTKTRLPQGVVVSRQQIENELVQSYREKRLRDAEAKFLSPFNLTFQEFMDRGDHYRQIFGRDTYVQLLTNIHQHELDVSLLIAGFDTEGDARIFSIESDEARGVPQQHDEIPGFHAIGSGGIAANHIMYYRSMNPRVPARLAAVLVFEAKYFGEHGAGVGPRTDLYVWQSGKDPVRQDEIFIEEVLVKKFMKRLEPREITRRLLEDLNKVEDFGDIPKTPIPKKNNRIDRYKAIITRVGEEQ